MTHVRLRVNRYQIALSARVRFPPVSGQIADIALGRFAVPTRKSRQSRCESGGRSLRNPRIPHVSPCLASHSGTGERNGETISWEIRLSAGRSIPAPPARLAVRDDWLASSSAGPRASSSLPRFQSAAVPNRFALTLQPTSRQHHCADGTHNLLLRKLEADIDFSTFSTASTPIGIGVPMLHVRNELPMVSQWQIHHHSPAPRTIIYHARDDTRRIITELPLKSRACLQDAQVFT